MSETFRRCSRTNTVLVFFFLCPITATSLLAQNKDTASVSLYNSAGTIQVYTLVADKTFSWRSTPHYYSMNSWNTSQYTEGYMQRNFTPSNPSNAKFIMNYRLLFPVGYDPSFSGGYPLIVMLHGAGERGNCWGLGNCYCKSSGSACDSNGDPKPGTDPRFLNNDNNLTHGGEPHLDAVNLAGTKKPGDPTLAERAFPGFVLFAQNESGWTGKTQVADAIRIVRAVMKKYNIDPDRVYLHGLSNGGEGVYWGLDDADWLFAAAAPMSAISSTPIVEYDSITTVPLWIFQGAKDTDPSPQETETLIDKFRNAGGTVRYTKYQNIGHATWNSAYNEHDFFSWFLTHTRRDIHVYYDNPNICNANGNGARLALAQGFLAYQWQRDGQTISGAMSDQYIATIPGVYRARFSRKSAHPTEAQWNAWSNPVTVSESGPEKATISQNGTTFLPDLNNNSTHINLIANGDFVHYYWYKNGTLYNTGTNADTTQFLNLLPGNCSAGNCANNGAWTLQVAGYNNCPSPVSNTKYLFFGNAPAPVGISKPTNFSAHGVSPSSILLTWNDVSALERHYEIWRRNSAEATWHMSGFTDEDVTSFQDTGLQPGATYWYKIRAISNTARSDYAPGNSNDAAGSLVVITGNDNTPPTIPQDLTATATWIKTITLTWKHSTDNSGIKGYFITYNSNTISTNSTDTTYVFNNLDLNTVYNFNVQAIDLSGNYSQNSNQATTDTYVTGFFYKESTGTWVAASGAHAGEPDIQVPDWTWTTVDPEYTGKVSNINIDGPPPAGPRVQDDYYRFQFDGYLYINQPASVTNPYQFRLISNDAAQLYLDGTKLAEDRYGSLDDPDLVDSVTTASINSLSAGPHHIVINFMDYTGSETLIVKYAGPDTGSSGLNFIFTPLPTQQLRSGDAPSQTPPPAPTALTIPGIHITELDLQWSYSGPAAHFEIFRSTSSSGPFAKVAQSNVTNLADTTVGPGTTYYYKVRAVNSDGTSAFTGVKNATTTDDNIPPSKPDGLTVTSTTLATATVVWNNSTDNVGVTGYEIFVDNSEVGTSSIPGFTITGLSANTTYHITVRAVDARDNKSAFSDIVDAITANAVAFYSKSSGSLNALGTWGSNANGSGASPGGFDYNAQYYYISNRTTTTTGGAWTVEGNTSKVIISNGVTLTADNVFDAQVDIEGSGELILDSDLAMPVLLSLAPQSTVEYKSTTNIQRETYGNLILSGTGYRTFDTDTTTVLGNLTIGTGTAMRGAPDNSSVVNLKGNLASDGVPGFTPQPFSVGLIVNKNGSQQISSGGALGLFSVMTGPSTTLSVNNSGSPFDLTLGSTEGGGLSLATGSKLDLKNNNVILTGASTINKDAAQGAMAIDGGEIGFSSTSNSNSHLYFDALKNTATKFAIDMTGSGSAVVRDSLKITKALKIANGTLASGGYITLLSNAQGTANLEEIEGTGAITGNLNVQHYLAPKGKIFAYLSSPVDGVTVADWQHYFPITGNFSGSSPDDTDASMFTYDEANGGWVAYPPSGGSNTAPIQKGAGYSAYLYNGDHAATIKMSGVPYQGNYDYDLHNGSGIDTTGWNLVGNPYASTISWANNGWNKDGVNRTVWVKDDNHYYFSYFDPESGTTLGTLPNGIIESGQAFWVQAFQADPELIITEASKVSGDDSGLRTGSDDYLMVSLSNGTNTDAAFLLFDENASDAYDKELDAYKRPNDIFSLSILSRDGVPLAVNHLSNNYCNAVQIGLQNMGTGSYTLKFDSLATLSNIDSAFLTDHFANTIVDLMAHGTYEFTTTSDPASSNSQRFVLSFNCSVTGLADESERSFKAVVYPNPAQADHLNLRVSSAATEPIAVGIHDLFGRILYNGIFEPVQLANGKTIQFQQPLAGGVYLITVQQSKKMIVQKVIIDSNK